MNRIQYMFLCLVRLILVLAAPRFAFFLASKDCSQRATKIGRTGLRLTTEVAQLRRVAAREELDSLGQVRS
jgi:hypothetical protein